MPKIDLLPCPFCGKRDTAKCITVAECDCMDNPTEWDKTHYGVVCCAAILGGCGASTGWNHSTPEEAAKEWNTRESCWIPCSERLPDKDGEYLCANNGGFKILPYRNGEFYNICLDGVLRCCNSSVTHWMPIPELPKEV